MGASAIMTIPQVAPDGVRQTVNAYITPAQTTWNVRSALNVAALNCLADEHAGILPNYKLFLENFDKPLDKANDAVEAEFREKYGDRKTGRAELDSYMTKVYNYFTMPPAKAEFCDAALELSNESVMVAPADLESFSARALTRFEGVFEDFFRSFERYRTNLATWDRLYGTPAGLYPSYQPSTQMAEADTMQADDGVRLLNAPVDAANSEQSGAVTLGTDPVLNVPQSTPDVAVEPSTAATSQGNGVTIVLPETAATSTPEEIQGPPEPDPS
ncbi:hypothetical protein DL238_08245 [Alteriqipengyuania lutimaris]|uniref:Uncharacterized protein n=2 Tax=Alteriqipengyuania lutimaris TaxID=1538146 RepID=A0A395LKP0_9SPHN|nr:hypothetical protein DL238_08245 [Alteriqipengyuania lutimaris]